MLVMRRRSGESILIGENIEIQILDIGRTRVKVGINAPRELVISAKEAKLVREENIAASRLDSRQVLEALVQRILKADAKDSPQRQESDGA
jgi:carbon storage regulator